MASETTREKRERIVAEARRIASSAMLSEFRGDEAIRALIAELRESESETAYFRADAIATARGKVAIEAERDELRRRNALLMESLDGIDALARSLHAQAKLGQRIDSDETFKLMAIVRKAVDDGGARGEA